MAILLPDAHIVLQQRLRDIVANAIRAIWRGLLGYDRPDADQFIAQAVPLVLAGQRQSVALTEAFLARELGRRPLGVNVDNLVGAAVRNGTEPEEVYHRPFVDVWTGLATGTQWEDAVQQGENRATSTAEMDVALASRATLQAVQDADPGIYGFRRKADVGACPFCQLVDGAYVKQASASPLHPHCGCNLEPLLEPHPKAKWLPSGASVEEGFAIHEHGELGAVIGGPDHHFAGPGQVTGVPHGNPIRERAA